MRFTPAKNLILERMDNFYLYSINACDADVTWPHALSVGESQSVVLISAFRVHVSVCNAQRANIVGLEEFFFSVLRNFFFSLLGL